MYPATKGPGDVATEEFADLLARVRQGDEAALARLVQSYEPKVRLATHALLGPALQRCLDSVDVVQSVHMAVLSGLRQDKFAFSSPVQLVALAVNLVRRKVALHWRRLQRFGHEFAPGPPAQAAAQAGLPVTETTLADRLKAAGYSTGLVGKWHLGYQAKFHPLQRGFEEFFGFLAGAHSYFGENDERNHILRGTTPVIEESYLTDAFGREAVAFLDRHKKDGKPFFLYWAFNAVHRPLQASDTYLRRFASIADKRRRTYAAMTSAMDDAVGRVLAKLRDSGLEENTLIFFLSDNGGPPDANASNNAPLRGHTGQTLEGGIRVPFLVQWKGRLPAGRTYDRPVIQLDIHSTALAAAGILIKPDMKLDGVNLLPYLQGDNKAAPHEVLYWRFGKQMAIRKADWKLVRHNKSPDLELYNLAQDIGESKNLATADPDKFKELKAAWDKWDSTLVKPLWGPPRR